MVKETTYHHFDSDNESFNSFVVNTLVELFNIKKKDANSIIKSTTLNSLFDNIFIVTKDDDKYEVNITFVKNTENIYLFKINKLPKEVHIRFGCELETCFIMNCNNESSDISLSEENWSENVITYLNLNIIPYLKKEFLNRFRYAFIKGYHAKYGTYLDLKTGKVLSSELKDINEYDTLVFSPDGSIECEEDTNAVPCEIISPILSSINEIKILYEGLMTESCHQANRSMGFHVNVSAVDENDKMIKLTRGILSEIIHNWLPYESDNYKKLRGDGSEAAVKIGQLLIDDEYIYILKNWILQRIDNQDIKNVDFYNPYGLNLWLAHFLVNKVKYLSMTHHKQNNVIEFRIFPAKVNIKQLLQYTKDAISIFEYSLNNYIQNCENITKSLQLNFSKYEYIHFELSDSFTINSNLDIVNLEKFTNIWISWFVFKEAKTLFSKKLNFSYLYKIKKNTSWKSFIADDGHMYEYDVYLSNNEFHFTNRKEVSDEYFDKIYNESQEYFS